MLHTLNSVLAPAVMERLTLVINHVLGAEAVATERPQPHAGRTLQLAASAWPSLLPPLPRCVWRITPAGLLEWCGDESVPAPDLVLRVDASNPALLLSRLLAGERPSVAVEGHAELAGDLNWLMQNLRWDVAADLERLFPPPVAAQLHRLGQALAQGVRAAVQGAASLRDRLRPRG
jgi:ubiquinone biosynthesis accessory factor UbiJ